MLTHINKQDDLALQTQAELLGISRSSIYYQPRPLDPDDFVLMNQIDGIYTDMPYYGVVKMTEELKKQGFTVGPKRIRRLMREMGIEAIYPRPNLSQNQEPHPKFPYLLKGIPIIRPNQVWGTDITYIKLREGFLYLVAFMDWFSRFVISWKLSITLEASFVVEAAKEALRIAIPEITNSDQGVQFTSNDYINTWDQTRTRISMDGRGRCMDNIFTERLWRSVKYENIYPSCYDCVLDVKDGLTRYFNDYNYRRLHQSLNYQTPADIYFK